MKASVRNALIIVILFLSFVLQITIQNKSARDDEIKNNLSTVVEQTLTNMMKTKTYQIKDYQEFLADLIENLAVKLNTKSDITVNVLKADIDKGLLSVEVVEKFKYPNGNEGNVKFQKTIVFEDITDSETAVPTYTVKFYQSQTDMQNNADCYKQYNILSGDPLIQPKAPTQDGKTFVGWRDSTGNPVDFHSNVTADSSYYAVFN